MTSFGGYPLSSVFVTQPAPRVTLSQLTQTGLQVMELGGYVRILNRTGMMEKWAGGRLPLELTPKSLTFLKDRSTRLWSVYADGTMADGHNSSRAARRCVHPDVVTVPGGFDVIDSQSGVQARIMTAVRQDVCYMVDVVDVNGNVVGSYARNEINVYQ